MSKRQYSRPVLPPGKKSVLLLGATGTAGRGVAEALLEAGHKVVAMVRPEADTSGLPSRLYIRFGRARDIVSLRRDGFEGDHFDAVISCIASRTGLPEDAWAVDHKANRTILAAAREHEVPHMILVSAICVQRPLLEFQKAKLAFEKELIESGLSYSIIRPTAFFKSLAGQIERVQNGKRYLLFGNGRGTASKPISDRDLGRFVTLCLTDPAKQNAILPIGGPGPALTPRDVGEMIFRIAGQKPKFRRVPPWVMSAIVGGLDTAARFRPELREKAELARIGRYYATESMLVLDKEARKYVARATPEFGEDRLEDYIRDVIAGRAEVDLREHAVF